MADHPLARGVWPDALLNARVCFWQCPVEEHSRRRGVVTVEWGDDGIARCTHPGCDRTSAPARPSPSEETARPPHLLNDAAQRVWLAGYEAGRAAAATPTQAGEAAAARGD